MIFCSNDGKVHDKEQVNSIVKRNMNSTMRSAIKIGDSVDHELVQLIENEIVMVSSDNEKRY